MDEDHFLCTDIPQIMVDILSGSTAVGMSDFWSYLPYQHIFLKWSKLVKRRYFHTRYLALSFKW